MKSAGSFFGGLLVGVILGATVALLYAPQSGDDTRKQIKKKIEDLENELEILRGKMKDKSGELKDNLKVKIQEIEERIKHLMNEYKKTKPSKQVDV